jgi:23S rRNA (cytosine1962-C5)-methyltransferase
MRTVHVRRTKRLHAGHLWVFSNEIAEQVKDYEPGSLVEVRDMHEAFLGSGYINPHSLIAVRLLTWKPEAIDREFLERRIRKALHLRERFFSGRDAVRLIYSEGDYLPGLIVDRYASHLSVQILTMGMERMKDTIIGLLDEVLQPEVIVLKNEGRSRSLEGLPLYKEVVKGEAGSRAIITEGPLRLEVDLYAGQKTGYFLDQKENRRVFGGMFGGGKGLDLFCYTGAWALTAAAAGASVTGVDESLPAIAQAGRNAQLNGLEGRAAFVAEDVFSFLRRHVQGNEKTLDFIVLDPPAFVKSAAKLKEATKAYRELNALCMRLLKPGGLLVTSSCSYHLGTELFVEMLRAAGKDSGRDLRLLELRSQDRDHPVLLSMPETEYLKCAFLLVD